MIVDEINHISAVTSANEIRSEVLKKDKRVESDNAAQDFYEKASANQKEVVERKEAIMAELKRQEEIYRQNRENQQYEQTGRLLG